MLVCGLMDLFTVAYEFRLLLWFCDLMYCLLFICVQLIVLLDYVCVARILFYCVFVGWLFVCTGVFVKV